MDRGFVPSRSLKYRSSDLRTLSAISLACLMPPPPLAVSRRAARSAAPALPCSCRFRLQFVPRLGLLLQIGEPPPLLHQLPEEFIHRGELIFAGFQLVHAMPEAG